LLVGTDRLHGNRGRYEVRACAACGSGITFPLVDADELTRFYPREYGAYVPTTGSLSGRISKIVVARQTRASLARAPLSSVATFAPGRVLDVGSGRGDLAAAFVARGWEATGVEPSVAACAAAAARGVDVRQGTLERVELEPASFDAAYFHHSLEHTDDVRRDLDIVARALRPDGVIAITVPNFESWQAKRYGDRWYHLDLPRHRVHFTRKGLTEALERAGFTGIEASTSTSSVGLPATIQYALFGRCLFPSGLSLRVSTGLCILFLPLARALDRGGGDQLHVTAQAPS
jgi:SAM-dependent methyltransferase